MQTLRKRKNDISIIIPVYNLENYLQPMLDCLKHQDLGDYTAEIIFVLNNCTDNSEGVIRDSGLDCQILYCMTRGCGPARNVGLDAADGEYIWMMDGDDWLTSKTAIRQVLDRAKRDRLDILRIPFVREKFNGDYYSMVWQYLFRYEFVKEIRFPDFQPGEDGAYMDAVLNKTAYTKWSYLSMPSMDVELYYYNYMRTGSNMYRFLKLHEKI